MSSAPNSSSKPPAPPNRWRRIIASRLVRGAVLGLGLLIAIFVILVLLGMPPSWPTDWLLNLGSTEEYPQWKANAQDAPLVVLQHGIWRSSMAFAKLERSLKKHGYRVLNQSYPSTKGSLEEHAARLKKSIDQYLKEFEEPRRMFFVSHSMGGLVMRHYQGLKGARKPDAYVFIGVPHRGAMLCDLRKDLWMFRWIMGSEAAYQLSPSAEFYDHLQPLPTVPVGTIIGGLGDGQGFHDQVPGDDDGTVAVSEAHCPEETASVLLPQRHTKLTFSDEMIANVLSFLKTQSFRDG